MKKNNGESFASVPAEEGYQAAKRAGARITRDQFREALLAYEAAEARSKAAYDKFCSDRLRESKTA